jgi:hypothetical protein
VNVGRNIIGDKPGAVPMLPEDRPTESRVLSPESWLEAVEVFDGANLLWGQFYVHSLAGRPEAEGARAVRAALGEAALSVPRSGDAEELRAFLAALREAREQLLALLQTLPPELMTGPVLETPDAILEAIELLEPAANG